MRAAIQRRYGPAHLLRVEDLPDPVPGPGQVLIAVEAAAVTTADWRLRAAAFPAYAAIPGRLMFGLFRPKQPVQGRAFAGRVVALGAGVTRVAPGDRVFGIAPAGGAHAERLVVAEDAPLARLPEGVTAAEAAAAPFGALTAYDFLKNVAGLRAGQSVLILGASGGVGVWAVQIARALGARVTAVGGPASGEMLRGLGADEVLDYTAADPTAGPARHDVVFDTAGVATYARARRALKPGGLFLPLEFGLREIARALTGRFRRGPRVAVAIGAERAEDLAWVAARLADGTLRAVIGRTFPLSRIAEAHALVESRHPGGAVVVEMPGAPEERRAA